MVQFEHKSTMNKNVENWDKTKSKWLHSNKQEEKKREADYCYDKQLQK